MIHSAAYDTIQTLQNVALTAYAGYAITSALSFAAKFFGKPKTVLDISEEMETLETLQELTDSAIASSNALIESSQATLDNGATTLENLKAEPTDILPEIIADPLSSSIPRDSGVANTLTISLTRREALARAKALRIKGYSRMTTASLLEAIAV